MRYNHTQRAPLYLILLAFAALAFTVSTLMPPPALRVTMLLTGSVMVLLAASFHHLTITDETDHLLIAFGPLSLFRKRIPYSEIHGVERSWLTALDGWGLQYNPLRGTTWSLWGFGCVILHLAGGRTLRLGTDDPEGLAAFLKAELYKSWPTSSPDDRLSPS